MEENTCSAGGIILGPESCKGEDGAHCVPPDMTSIVMNMLLLLFSPKSIRKWVLFKQAG